MFVIVACALTLFSCFKYICLNILLFVKKKEEKE